MISGMPRPVKKLAAEMEMLVRQSLADGQPANEIKQLLQKHANEASYVLQIEVGDEEYPAEKQSEMLKAKYMEVE
ncbi:hypothetical protein C5167_020553 [Papaver somniferum]|uniref:Uncharacterized protein n=1 Tax=Papaver somniferum TaxID=3469 RepID=A0A4Y7IXJ6_PAPSO|nr:hypothetical protein C5167_020553 [Papaver somniferum]